jgi:DNA invertase Pin-like site-specific DNA recombinase
VRELAIQITGHVHMFAVSGMGRAMIQMASIFGEQERSMLRSRVLAGLER